MRLAVLRDELRSEVRVQHRGRQRHVRRKSARRVRNDNEARRAESVRVFVARRIHHVDALAHGVANLRQESLCADGQTLVVGIAHDHVAIQDSLVPEKFLNVQIPDVGRHLPVVTAAVVLGILDVSWQLGRRNPRHAGTGCADDFRREM